MKTQFFIEDKEVSIYEYGDFKYKYGYIERTNVVDGTVHKVLTYDEVEYKKEILRKKRKPILVALDVYKSNVNYGTIKESLEERAKIEEWYQQLLDINQTENALENIPEKVAYYLGG